MIIDEEEQIKLPNVKHLWMSVKKCHRAFAKMNDCPTRSTEMVIDVKEKNMAAKHKIFLTVTY